ncbi:MAG TPA: hypothetical protein VJ276_21665 [Thermoanaerobaculia bacterium]|nr:hypothetical protein [Thermoanaerobaculia bacterium]
MRRALVLGSLTLAALDITDAIVFWFLYRGVMPMRIFQSVAAGLLGRDAAIHGGLRTALLGAALHLFIATCIVLTYYLASLRLPLLARHPVLCGLAYGVAVWLVMTFVVVPLSAAQGGRLTLPVALNGVVGHMLFVGLPAALAARRSLTTAVRVGDVNATTREARPATAG